MCLDLAGDERINASHRREKGRRRPLDRTVHRIVLGVAREDLAHPILGPHERTVRPGLSCPHTSTRRATILVALGTRPRRPKALVPAPRTPRPCDTPPAIPPQQGNPPHGQTPHRPPGGSSSTAPMAHNRHRATTLQPRRHRHRSRPNQQPSAPPRPPHAAHLPTAPPTSPIAPPRSPAHAALCRPPQQPVYEQSQCWTPDIWVPNVYASVCDAAHFSAWRPHSSAREERPGG